VCQRVKALSASATLLEIMVASTAARGAPLNADKPKGKAPMHEKKETYVRGAFTGGSMQEYTDIESSSISNSFKGQKKDVLSSTSHLITNIATSGAQVEGRKQKGKTVHVPAASTQRGHRRDMAQWRIEQAAAALGPTRAQLFSDEGTLADGTGVLVMGSTSLLNDGTVNLRFCGISMPLPNKMGATVAAGMLDIAKRNQIGTRSTLVCLLFCG
jgi:hypothetical protein